MQSGSGDDTIDGTLEAGPEETFWEEDLNEQYRDDTFLVDSQVPESRK